MGPKGYRISWLGKKKERMFSILQRDNENLGEYYFMDLLNEVFC